VGGGPAGLRAAEVAARAGARVIVFEQKPSVGRKFLVAGKGGLNLTHEASVEEFAAHYTVAGMDSNNAMALWQSLLRGFDSNALRDWAGSLGIETFCASSGRVYPKEMKSAPLLRRWVELLRGLGVEFRMRQRWTGLRSEKGLELEFSGASDEVRGCMVRAGAVVLALGGASWPQTGSTGIWSTILSGLGVKVAPLVASNCGWECAWPQEVLDQCEGKPLKNVRVSAGAESVRGELLVTRYGLEGGALYALGAELRTLPHPILSIDFKPDSSPESLLGRLGSARHNFLNEAALRWRLGETVNSLLHGLLQDNPPESAEAMVRAVKRCEIQLEKSRPVEEAISSAGGVDFAELDEFLMVRSLPGVFVAGEMLAWDAPTGGYLLQGCFSTGTLAGKGAMHWTTNR
jgi:uncharacterized flavoprotein (TIGR03862 family)